MARSTIRLAGPDDAPALYALLQAAYAPLAADGVHFTITRTSAAQVSARLARHTVFVLEQPGADGEPEPLGTVSIRFPWTAESSRHPLHPFIHWYAVAPSHARQGLGRELLDHAEDHFLRGVVKAPATYLATAARHPWLVRLYEARGYEVFDRSTNPLGTDLVWLRKILLPDLYRALPAPQALFPIDVPLPQAG